MNISKLETALLSTKKDLSSSSAKIRMNLLAKDSMTCSEEKIAKLASDPTYAKLLKSVSEKITTPKNLNLEYFASNIKKLAK